MLIFHEMHNFLNDKRMFHLFKKKLKIGYLLFSMNTNYRIANYIGGN